MTRGNSKISERSVGEDPVLTMYQKPATLNLTNSTLPNERLQVKLFKQKGLLHDTQQLLIQQRQVKKVAKTEELKVFYLFLLMK